MTKSTISHKQSFLPIKKIFGITACVVLIIVLCIVLWGLEHQKNFAEISLISLTIISLALFVFLVISLYKGSKIDDNDNKLEIISIPEIPDINTSEHIDFGGEGIAGLLMGILLWIVVSILFVILLWIFTTVIWAGVILCIGMVYWVFFQAVKIVLKHSSVCKNNIVKSILYAALYTILYTSWIYVLVFIANSVLQWQNINTIHF